MTREHRENLVKLAKQLSNKAKDSLRRVRSNAVTQVKRAKEGQSEDTLRLVEKQVGGGGTRGDHGAAARGDGRVCLSFSEGKLKNESFPKCRKLIIGPVV